MDSNSILHNLLNNIETKLKINNPIESKQSSKITSDLNYFKEISQKNYDSMPPNDSFKYSSNEIHNSNRKPFLSSYNNSNQVNPSQNDIRQIIEREMEPYLFSAKNDLKFMIENFTRDLGDYKFIKSELNLVKEAVVENKKLILISKEDIDKKISEYSEKFYLISKQFEDLKYNFNDTNNRFKNYEKSFVKVEEKLQNVNSVKDRISQIEMSNRNVLKKIEEEILCRGDLSTRVKNLENNHETYQKETENLYEQIENFKNNSSSLSDRIDDIGKATNKIFQNESQINFLKEKVNTNAENVSNIKIKFENLDTRCNRINEKIGKNESATNEEFFKLSERYSELQGAQNNFKEKLSSSIAECQNISKNERTSSLSAINMLKKQIEEDQVKNKTYIEETCFSKLTTANEYTDKCKEETNILNTKVNSSVNSISKILNENTTKIESFLKEKQLTIDNQKQIIQIENSFKEAFAKINNTSKQNEIDKQEMKIFIKSVKEKLLEKESERDDRESLSNRAQPTVINEEQAKINLIFQNGLEKLIHQIISISGDVSSLKSDNHRFEENFISSEKNFQKLNDTASKLVIIEKKQNLVNEIIKTLTSNYDNDKKTAQAQYESITRIQKEAIENTIKIFNGLKSDSEKKLNAAYGEILSKLSSSISSNNESKNLINNPSTICDNKIKELIEQNEIHRQKIEKAVSKLINITVERELIQTSQKLIEADDKWAKISNYLKNKIEHIEEFINFMSSKYDINYDQGYEAVSERVEGNQNNVTKMEVVNFEEDRECSNFDNREFLYNLMLYPSGVVNNFISDKFSLQTAKNNLKELIIEKLSAAVPAKESEFNIKIKSIKNSIDEKYEKNADDSNEKFVKNMRYLSTDPMNYHEIKNDMKGYLNKYLIIPRQYENILEFDGEDNYMDVEPNSQRVCITQKKTVDDCHSFGRDKNKQGDMVYFLGDENEFFDDDFDKNSDEVNIY